MTKRVLAVLIVLGIVVMGVSASSLSRNNNRGTGVRSMQASADQADGCSSGIMNRSNAFRISQGWNAEGRLQQQRASSAEDASFQGRNRNAVCDGECEEHATTVAQRKNYNSRFVR
ncbi:MAG: hypothetical protein WCR02_06265 [Sphaerochaetaceae bacterium]